MRPLFAFFCAVLFLGCVGLSNAGFADDFSSAEAQVSLVIPPRVRIEEQSLLALSIKRGEKEIDVTSAVSLSSNLAEEFHVVATPGGEPSGRRIDLTLEPI